MSNWVILKFGGSSVAEAEHWQTIADQVSSHLERDVKPVLVLSALKNVSNLLEALLHQALAGVFPTPISHLKELHLGFATQLGLSIQAELAPIFDVIEQQCEAIFSEKIISPSRHAAIVACGELLSTTIGAQYLSKVGVKSHWVDARQILSSRNNLDPWHHFTSAECDYSSNSQITQQLSKLDGAIITQGFIASDENNATVLLGREGSDTSASYIGAILQAQEIQIWTDVTGVFSSNPREIDGTLSLTELSYSQANLMARLGAKVLHPRAVEPAQKFNIPIRVKSTSAPSHPGTCISSSSRNLNGFGLVFEPQLTRVSMPKTHASEKLENRLQSEGYDKVAEFMDPQTKQADSFWLYTNSDKPELSSQQLVQLLDRENTQQFKIEDKLSLISIIGNDSIFSKLEEQKLLDKVNSLQRYRDESNHVIYIVVPSEDCLASSQKLHDEIVGSL